MDKPIIDLIELWDEAYDRMSEKTAIETGVVTQYHTPWTREVWDEETIQKILDNKD
jgi:hypothetical protein